MTKLVAPPTTIILQTLINKLQNSNDYKKHLKLFKEFIDKKDRFPYNSLKYYLYFDLDELAFKIATDLDIPHNSLVLLTGFVPSKKEAKDEKIVQDYQFEWMGVKK